LLELVVGANSRRIFVAEEFSLVSLVSVLGRNRCYLCERVERVAKGETVEIADIDAVFMEVAENVAG